MTNHDSDPLPDDRSSAFLGEVSSNLELEQELSGRDWEGVPAPYGFQLILRANEWSEHIADEGVSAELVDEILAEFAEREAEYPGAVLWDGARMALVQKIIASGNAQYSINLLCDMNSPHVAAEIIDDLAVYGLVPDMLPRLYDETSRLKVDEFLQAMMNRLLLNDPNSPLLNLFETMLRNESPGYDPVNSWLESQRLRNPSLGDEAASFVRDETRWPGVPLRFRQHVAMLSAMTQVQFTQEVSTESVRGMAVILSDYEQLYPEARAWDELRCLLGNELVQRGYPTFALDLARTLRKPENQLAFVGLLVRSNAEEEALELATLISDPRVMVETLIATNWNGDVALQRLEEIIVDESYPTEKRIGCLEAVRDLMREMGSMDEVERYEALIQSLRDVRR